MIAFLVNALIKSKSSLMQQITSVFGSQIAYTVYYSDYPGHIMELAERCATSGSRYLIAVGGDGTIYEVINGLMKTPRAIRDKVTMGIIPAGTGNDFVRSLSIDKEIIKLRLAIEHEHIKHIDLGYASFLGHNHTPQERYFINIADIGLGGVVAQKLLHSRRLFGAKFTYLKSIISTLLTFENTNIHCVADGFTYQGKIKNLVIANGRYFGGGLGIAPNAKLDDGLFDLVLLKNIGIWDLIRYQAILRKNMMIQHAEVAYHQASELSVDTVDKPALPIEMDGEFIGYTPVTFKLLTKQLNILVSS